MNATAEMANPAPPRWQRLLEHRQRLPKLPLWAGLALIAAGFALVAIGVGRRESDRTVADAGGEPDAYLEDADVSHYRNDGTLHYRMQAARVVQVQQGGFNAQRMEAPVVALHVPDAPPWHLEADAGEFRLGPEKEEQVVLRGDVRLLQRHDDGRFTELRTAALTYHLGRELVETALPVMIATESTRSEAAGFNLDVRSGRLQLLSSPNKRVTAVVEPPR